MSSDQFSLAENAFLSAVLKVMHTQAELAPLRQRLAAELEDAERANDAALKDRGIDETTPIDRALDYQETLMNEAIARSGFADDHPVVTATRRQAREMRLAFQEMARQEAQSLGRLQGPSL